MGSRSSQTPHIDARCSENGRQSPFRKTVRFEPIVFLRLEDESAFEHANENRNRKFWALLKDIFFRNFIVKDMTHQYDSSIFSFKSSWFNDELMIETFLGRSSKIQFSNVNIQLEIKNSKLWFGLGFGKPIYIQWINEKTDSMKHTKMNKLLIFVKFSCFYIVSCTANHAVLGHTLWQ